MEKLNCVEFLLKNYHQMKKEIQYISQLMASPIMETYEDTILELNYKTYDFLQPSRGP